MADKKKSLIHLEFTEKTTADLRGRQSVRTTFKLSERSIEALSILARQLGIKQKSLFDHLIEDTQALKMIAREADDFSGRLQRIAKTYVISRKTLENLERVSIQYDTPRDALVEYSIERILPLLAREKKKHTKRKMLLEELRGYLQKGSEILEHAENDLGRNDPIFLEILNMMRVVKHCCQGLEHSVERGSKIEEF
ncbi:MAG: hypothetical protein WBB19_00490 [Desulforhopalus sp.]